MSFENPLRNKPDLKLMNELVEKRDWAALDEMVGFSPEEAERILREEPMIDGALVNQLLEELEKSDLEQSSEINQSIEKLLCAIQRSLSNSCEGAEPLLRAQEKLSSLQDAVKKGQNLSSADFMGALIAVGEYAGLR